MNQLKEKALEKMLVEMAEKHSRMEDTIHNWLCIQEDDELLQGILKDDRSIKECKEYCISEAYKYDDGESTGVPDEVVFGWIRNYFVVEELPKVEKKIPAVVKAPEIQTEENKPQKTKKQPNKPQFTPEEGEQLDLLEFLND